MNDLPPNAWTAAGLVGAVHDHDGRMTAHWLRLAARDDGLEALAMTLAAMVDDEKTPAELLAWTDPAHRDARAWRRQLTDQQCAEYRAAFARGDRSPDVVDGNREYDRRRARRARQERREQVAA